MIRTTALGCEMKGTWLALTSTVFVPTRFA